MVSKSTKSSSSSNPSRRPTDIDSRIGKLIRDRRLAIDMTQDELAKHLKITQSQLQKYESGENRITASRLVDCARALQVSIAWFYQWADFNSHDTPMSRPGTDEAALIEAFRDLSPAGRSQLVSIAEVLRGKRDKA